MIISPASSGLSIVRELHSFSSSRVSCSDKNRFPCSLPNLERISGSTVPLGQVWHEGVSGILFCGQEGLGFSSSFISLTAYAEGWVRKFDSRTWWSWQPNLQWCRLMPDTRLRTSFAHISHITMAGETEARGFWKSSISAKLGSVWAACLCSSLSSSSPRRQQATPPPSWSFPTFGPYLPSHPFLTSSFPSSSFFLSLFPFLSPS